MVTRRILLFLGFLCLLLPVGGSAHACSCAGGDPRASLEHADAAFVGTLTFRGEPQGEGARYGAGIVEMRFRVDEDIKGNLGREVVIRSSGSSSSCGLSASLGRPTAMFLQRKGDGWSASLCSQIEPDVLRRVAAPLPAPNSQGPVSLLVAGSFGDARSVALDREGGIVAYGEGDGRIAAFGVCEGSRRVVEAVTKAGNNRWTTIEVAVRDVQTLELIRTSRVEELEGAPGRFPVAVSCRDPTGDEIYIAGDGQDLKVVSLHGRNGTVLYEGVGRAITFAEERDVAYLTVKKSIVELDMRNGKTRELAMLPLTPVSLALSPDESVLAGTNGGSPPKGRAFTVDLRTNKVSVGEGQWGDPIWLNRSTFVVRLHDQGAIRVYDTSAKPISFKRQSPSDPAVVAEGKLYGGADGVVTVSDDSGVRVLRAFDHPVFYALAYVDAGSARTSAGGVRTGPLVAVLAVLAGVVAVGLLRAAADRLHG